MFIIIFLVLVLGSTYLSESHSGIEWDKTYGGNGYDICTCLLQISNDEYILGGITDSYGSGKHDFFIIKINETGNIFWNKIYGGENFDSAYDIIKTNDNGFLIIGSSNSSMINGTGYDILLVKVNQTGELEWYNSYELLGEDQATRIIKTYDNNYLILGITKGVDDINFDFLLIKINGRGEVIWKKIYKNPGEEMAWSVIQTNDDGFVLCGYTSSFGSGHFDYWLVKTDSDGNELWNRTYGGKGDDGANSVIQTNDDGYIIAGYSEILLSYDFHLIKTNKEGYIQWESNFSKIGDERCLSMIRTLDNGFLLGGYSHSAAGYNFYIKKIIDNFYYTNNLKPISNAGEDIEKNINEPVFFNGSSYDPDGNIIYFEWDFDGDGVYEYQSKNNKEIKHFFNKSGNYSAFFKITDNNGSSSFDMKKIIIKEEYNLKSNFISEKIFVLFSFIFAIIIIIFINIIFYKKNFFNKILEIIQKKSKLLNKISIWEIYLFFFFIYLLILKTILIQLFSTPVIYNDEIIYSVLAKDIFNGNFSLIGYLPFSGAHPTTGYSYFLAPAYIFGNNMDLIYNLILFINCILSSLIIFPTYYIMKIFVRKKLSLYTSILIAVIPTVLAHNYLIMSENAFYLFFLITCIFIIKTYSYDRFDFKFIILSFLTSLSLGVLVLIRTLGIAMIGAIFFVFVYKLLKDRKIDNLKYGLIFPPFALIIVYMVIITNSITLGYNKTTHIDALFFIIFNTANYLRFIKIIFNEINYLSILTYFIFFSSSILLVFKLKDINKKIKEKLSVFILYSIISTFFLIIITVVHIFNSDHNIYTRYVSPGLIIIFILGIIGLDYYNNKYKTIISNYIFIGLILFFVSFFILFFPIENYKLVNNIDLSWISYFIQIKLFSLKVIDIIRSIFIVMEIIFIIFIIYKIKQKEKIFINIKHKLPIKKIIIISICISIFLSGFSIYKIYQIDTRTKQNGINLPAKWFMNNEPAVRIVMEDSFTSFSGGGMEKNAWDYMYSDMYFWVPNSEIILYNQSKLYELIISNEIETDYILSTHDLTIYYPIIEDFYMKSPSPMKKQEYVDWHIYKVE